MNRHIRLLDKLETVELYEHNDRRRMEHKTPNESIEHYRKKIRMARKYYDKDYQVSIEAKYGGYIIDVVAYKGLDVPRGLSYIDRDDVTSIAIEVGSSNLGKLRNLSVDFDRVEHIPYNNKRNDRVDTIRKNEGIKLDKHTRAVLGQYINSEVENINEEYSTLYQFIICAVDNELERLEED